MRTLLRIAMLIVLLGIIQLIITALSSQTGDIFGQVKRSLS